MKSVLKNLLIISMIVALIGLQCIAQNVYAESQQSFYRNVRENITQNGSAYLEGVAHKIMVILGIIGGVLVALLWVKVAIDYFSDDPLKKAKVKDDMMHALVGTMIIVMAVGGIIWMLARWIVGV